MKFIAIQDGPPDRLGNTPFTLFWPNDVICPCRPTPVRAQCFNCDIKGHLNGLRARGHEVELRQRKSGQLTNELVAAIKAELTPKKLVYSDDWRGERK